MNPKNYNPRRDFIKKSVFTAAGMSIIPGFVLGKDGDITSITKQLSRALAGQDGIKKVAFITHIYRNSAHADVIGTKLFLGIPSDDGMVAPQVKIVSVFIEQVGANDTGIRISAMNDTSVYPTVEEALTLGGDKLAVDAVIYVGEHGEYPYNRLGMKLYPRMNYLERIFRVFDASNRSVPVFTDKALSYSWLDSKWIYDRAKELNVPLMAGSSLPYCWRDKPLVHPIGVKIKEAVAIGYASLDAYGFHVTEILQCMVERRAGGETGVKSVEGLKGDDVWKAIDSGKISQKLVDAACDTIQDKETGNMREIVPTPYAVIVNYADGTKGTIMMLDKYVKTGWAYSANTSKGIVATEFVLSGGPTYAHFSYLALNIQKFIISGPTAPIERNLLTSGIIDMGIRSLTEGKVKETPFLNIKYSAAGYQSIRPTAPRPIGQSIAPFHPKEYEFMIPDAFKNK
ncbi:MAG: hypothetical protein HQ491_09415 [Bacteroidetes bacterium]|nr:hypothetical protein [Bacteroidota bacterium]